MLCDVALKYKSVGELLKENIFFCDRYAKFPINLKLRRKKEMASKDERKETQGEGVTLHSNIHNKKLKTLILMGFKHMKFYT